jgi:hypothetical protein
LFGADLAVILLDDDRISARLRTAAHEILERGISLLKAC